MIWIILLYLWAALIVASICLIVKYDIENHLNPADYVMTSMVSLFFWWGMPIILLFTLRNDYRI